MRREVRCPPGYRDPRPEPWQHHAEHEHLTGQFQDRCRETDPTTPLKDVDSLPKSSSERPRICQIRVAHPVYGGALNTSDGHPDPCQKSPFAIARTPCAIGGINGGIIRFFQAETTVLEPSQNVFWGWLIKTRRSAIVFSAMKPREPMHAEPCMRRLLCPIVCRFKETLNVMRGYRSQVYGRYCSLDMKRKSICQTH